ncbi:hypothetical protein FFONT_0268 [Fervidicoccus fontis Kam940]|uniref:Uncharacterized protein n=1 Tax=Fervidicoccus fontis (strain DSM 19380 / JCM 18336 / VKM B-2539 / Kam940) TaxID=1163730 RepID=H9ZZV1_FERFK|nr:hypothetical protein FFONT_0268 [Fervidicoccus fontis Kam940]
MISRVELLCEGKRALPESSDKKIVEFLWMLRDKIYRALRCFRILLHA